MKVRDARAIINFKKRAQQQQQKKKPPFASSPQIVDARQILKSKRKKNKAKFNSTSAVVPGALVKKELGQFLKSVADPKENNKNKRSTQSDKLVEFDRGGILTITSKGLASSSKVQPRRPLKWPQEATGRDNLLSNSRKNIVVVRPNEFVETKSIQQHMEIDQEDDLENLTLDDFPDIKTLPRGLTSSSLKTVHQSSVVQRTPWKPGLSSVSDQLQIPANTMVADVVENSKSNSSSQEQGYTVYVTNLQDFVTQDDVFELFSDVGHVASAQMLQPGTALVVYFTKAEALQACDSYHNRLLDGRPMQCSLLPASSSTGRSSLSSRLGGKLIPGSNPLPPSPPASTFLPSASFQRSHSPPSAKRSQRSVQFTVKLP